MNTSIIEILTNLGGMATMSALAVFFIKRWLDKVELAIRTLNRSVQELKTKQAILLDRESNLRGQLESLAHSIKETDKAVGKLSSSVGKAWLILQNSKLATSRMSDEFGGQES